MKTLFIVFGALLLPLGVVVTTAGVPLFGYEDAKVLAERPDAGSERRHVIGHVDRVFLASKALDLVDLDRQAKTFLKAVAGSGQVIRLRQCKNVFVYASGDLPSPGQKVAVSGFVYSVGGKGVMVGDNVLGALLTGGLPKPASVRRVPLWYFYGGIVMAAAGLVLLGVGIRMRKPVPRPLADRAPAYVAYGPPPGGGYGGGSGFGPPPGGGYGGGSGYGPPPGGGYGGGPVYGPPPGGGYGGGPVYGPPPGGGYGGGPVYGPPPGGGYGGGPGYGPPPGGGYGGGPAAGAQSPACPQCGHPMGWAPRRERWICPQCGLPPGA